MNFTGEIKRDLLKSVPEKRCCRLALLAAFLDTSGYLSHGRVGMRDEFSFTSEHEDIAEYLLTLAEQVFGERMTVTEAVRDPKHGRDKLTFTYAGANAGEYVEELTEYTAAQLLDRECCMQAYLKGAFLGSGSCILPRGKKTGYHLEVVFREEREATAFCELLDSLQLIGSVVKRGEKYVAYCKSRETISDLLSVIGAHSALRRLENVSAVREESNLENRRENCSSGNADRAATASVAQTIGLSALAKEGVIESLPLPLKEVAEGRLAHPEYSLTELGALLGVSKSALNHRMRKLMQLYHDRKL